MSSGSQSSPRRASYSPRQSSKAGSPGIRRLGSRAASSLRDGAVLFEGELSLSSDKYGVLCLQFFPAASSCYFYCCNAALGCVAALSEIACLQIQWHSDASTRFIVTLLSHSQYHSKRCYLSDDRLRAFLRASVDPGATNVIAVVDSDADWKRGIMSRQFCTEIATALAPHFRYAWLLLLITDAVALVASRGILSHFADS